MEEVHFLWDPNRTNIIETPTGSGDPIDILPNKTYKVLAGTSNTSAPGPERFSNKIRKAANKTALGSAIMLQVVTSLSAGSVPEMW